MIALIPMSGTGRRFSEAGYSIPKFLLPLEDGRPVIQRIRRSIGDIETIIVARRQDTKALQPRVIVEHFVHSHPRVVYLDRPTTGPLDTVLRVRKWLKRNEELLINYCDCWLMPDIQRFIAFCRDMSAPAAMVIFDSQDMRFGHTPNGDAIGGAFYFREAWDFVRAAKRIAKGNTEILGIPDVVQAVAGFAAFPTGNYIDIGTPQDYEAYLLRRGGS